MPLDALIDAHRRSARAARSAETILAETIAAVRELGFNRVALAQTAWFLRRERRYFCLDNYGEWRDIFIARNYHRLDPVHRAASRTNRCFAWSELGSILGANRFYRPIFAEAARHGLCSGMTVPIGVPGESPGCGSLAAAGAALPPRDHCRAAAWIVDEAFAEVRRVYGFPATDTGDLPVLSPRRLECLRLAALGYSDALIAEQMGITISTVHTYMKYLRQAYGARSRTQLGRLALQLGLVNIDDIIPQK